MIQSKAVLTVNAIAKRLSANDVSTPLHRVVVIDNRNLSVVYRSAASSSVSVTVIDNRNLSVVYRLWLFSCTSRRVIDTWNSSVVYRLQKY